MTKKQKSDAVERHCVRRKSLCVNPLDETDVCPLYKLENHTCYTFAGVRPDVNRDFECLVANGCIVSCCEEETNKNLELCRKAYHGIVEDGIRLGAGDFIADDDLAIAANMLERMIEIYGILDNPIYHFDKAEAMKTLYEIKNVLEQEVGSEWVSR